MKAEVTLDGDEKKGKKTENRMLVLAPLNGRQSMWVIWKDAKVEERTELSQVTPGNDIDV